MARRVGRALGWGGRVEGQTGEHATGRGAPVRNDAAVAAMPSVPAGDAGRVQPVPDAAEFAGLRALVADDSAINCTILKTFLERLGFEVTLAADGVQALERWRGARFDLLCLDIEMPELDGLSAFVAMKTEAEQRGAAMPMALAVTINAMTQEVTQYLQAGFDACLPKPFSRGDLVDLLRRRWPAKVA